MSGGEEAKGLAWGFAGVALFSLTLPATRAAVAHLDPVFVALGRALLAAACAVAVLAITRTRRPTPAEWRLLALSAAGVVFGFPLFTTWAMRHVPASHGAVVLAVLPLATAAAGAIVARERPSPGFWIVGVAGSLVVLAFALREGGGGVAAADLALLAAVVSAALGYALGARAAATMGGWQAISWSLVLCIPVLAPLVLLNLPAHGVYPGPAHRGHAELDHAGHTLGNAGNRRRCRHLNALLRRFHACGALLEALGSRHGGRPKPLQFAV